MGTAVTNHHATVDRHKGRKACRHNAQRQQAQDGRCVLHQALECEDKLPRPAAFEPAGCLRCPGVCFLLNAHLIGVNTITSGSIHHSFLVNRQPKAVNTVNNLPLGAMQPRWHWSDETTRRVQLPPWSTRTGARGRAAR